MLAGLVASLFVPEGGIHHIVVTERRLLTPVPKALNNPQLIGCSIGMAIEPIED